MEPRNRIRRSLQVGKGRMGHMAGGALTSPRHLTSPPALALVAVLLSLLLQGSAAQKTANATATTPAAEASAAGTTAVAATRQTTFPTADVLWVVEKLIANASAADVPPGYQGKHAFLPEQDEALLPAALRTPHSGADATMVGEGPEAGSQQVAATSVSIPAATVRRRLSTARRRQQQQRRQEVPVGQRVYRWVEPGPALKQRMVGLTIAFENSARSPQYGYASNLGDGRGITFGRCGFCTGTGDGILVINLFAHYRPRSKLASYLPALRKIKEAGGGDSTEGLEGFEQAVRETANDPAFRYAQDLMHEALYYRPAMQLSRIIGAQYGITKGQLYDAMVQHGWSDALNSDTVGGITRAATAASGGRPGAVDEGVWLSNFMKARRNVLTSSSKVWQDSVYRVEVYDKQLEKRNLPLNGPIRVWNVRVP